MQCGSAPPSPTPAGGLLADHTHSSRRHSGEGVVEGSRPARIVRVRGGQWMCGREFVPVREGVRGLFRFGIPAGFLADVPGGRRVRMMSRIRGQALVRACRPWPGCGPASGAVPSPAVRWGSAVLTGRSSPAGRPCWPRLVPGGAVFEAVVLGAGLAQVGDAGGASVGPGQEVVCLVVQGVVAAAGERDTCRRGAGAIDAAPS